MAAETNGVVGRELEYEQKEMILSVALQSCLPFQFVYIFLPIPVSVFQRTALFGCAMCSILEFSSLQRF